MVDVIIPTASPNPFIEEAVVSVINQKTAAALYIVENNSEDLAYQERLRRLAEKYSATYVFQPQRLDIYENWQRSMEIGNQEWIAFLHDDDIWSDSFLSDAAAINDESDLIIGGYRYFRESEERTGRFEKTKYRKCGSREELLVEMVTKRFHLSSVLFKREMKLRFPTTYRYYADQFAILDYVQRRKTIRVYFLENGEPNWIRIHRGQSTWNADVQLAAGREDAWIFRSFAANIAEEGRDRSGIGALLRTKMNDRTLVRLIAAIIGKRPLVSNCRLAVAVLKGRGWWRLGFAGLMRWLLQDLVWAGKRWLGACRAKS